MSGLFLSVLKMAIAIFYFHNMQKITDENINQFINQELGNWSANVQRILIEKLRKSKLVLSTELINSLSYQVHDATAESIASVQLAFNDYGRMRDMRRLFYTKMPPVEAMEKFVESIGINKFKYIPGYSRGKIPAENIAIKRIAWGIAMAKFKESKHKPKRWFARSFYGQINVLIQNLIAGYQDYAANSVVDQLKDPS